MRITISGLSEIQRKTSLRFMLRQKYAWWSIEQFSITSSHLILWLLDSKLALHKMFINIFIHKRRAAKPSCNIRNNSKNFSFHWKWFFRIDRFGLVFSVVASNYHTSLLSQPCLRWIFSSLFELWRVQSLLQISSPSSFIILAPWFGGWRAQSIISSVSLSSFW